MSPREMELWARKKRLTRWQRLKARLDNFNRHTVVVFVCMIALPVAGLFWQLKGDTPEEKLQKEVGLTIEELKARGYLPPTPRGESAAAPKNLTDAEAEKRIALLADLVAALRNNNYAEVTKILENPEVQDVEPHAFYSLGRIYEEGENGVTRDLDKARYWFERAATAGDWCGCANLELARAYEYGDRLNVKTDLSKARKYFERSAAQGNILAQVSLGQMYAYGWGGGVNYDKARDLFEKAASPEGHPFDEPQPAAAAKYELGALYEAGNGVPADLKKAWLLYADAASQGNRDAEYSLGRLNWDAKKSKAATDWFLKAANQNQPEAQFSIGIINYEGLDVPTNETLGRQWIELAAKNGSGDAQKWLDDHKTQ